LRGKEYVKVFNVNRREITLEKPSKKADAKTIKARGSMGVVPGKIIILAPKILAPKNYQYRCPSLQ
jgi:hypothetical protein